jgi:TusA-related sulfurtransferase
METNKEIDTRGLNCPLPILKAKKALADMASGCATFRRLPNKPATSW